MHDLKELLRPLDDQPMPDRWDRIQRRPVEPVEEPRRSRAGAMVTAGLVAAVVVGMVALLLPLGTQVKHPAGGEGQPPGWLVDGAYRMAYENGDISPRSVEWVRTDANTIAPAVGLQSGDPSREEYLVVLRGDFTGYGAKVDGPAGGPLPTGTILIAAFDPKDRQVTDWSIGNGGPDVPGLQPFELPPPDAYTSGLEGGEHIAVPPGWRQTSFALGWSGTAPEGVVISNHEPSLPEAKHGDFPQISAEGFPDNGVSLVVATMNGVIPGAFQPEVPPLSWDEFEQGPSQATGSTLSGLVFQGPDGLYTATVRIGDQASAIDQAAVKDVIASLTFESQPSAEPTSTTHTGLPTTDAVVNDRFVTSVQLDDGGLRVDPAPADMAPPLPRSSVEDEMWASPVFQGESQGVLGFGLVTMTKPQHGFETVTSVPAWIAFGWGATYHCPNMTAAPSPVELPSPGYRAVVVQSDALHPFSYEAASAPCGTLMDTKVLQATHIESVAWHQKGPVMGGKITITYTPTPCGGNPVFSIAGDPNGSTLTVEMTVTDGSISCPSPAPTTEAVDIPTGATQLEHAPTGYVRQL